MKRWKIKYENGQELLWYSPTRPNLNKDTVNIIDADIISVTEYLNAEYMNYINLIKENSSLITVYQKSNSIREIYQCTYYKGTIYITLSRDISDNVYYDIAYYQEHTKYRILMPVTQTISTPKEVWNLLSIANLEYIVYSHRYYGEPKLSKPKELKNIKSIGNAEFYSKKCNPKIFIQNNDVFIQHTDYFSSVWRSPVNEIGKPLGYYTKKYFNIERKEKFIYADNWGSIVLRNEAWVQLKNVIPLIQTENENIFAEIIINLQKQDKYSDITISEVEFHWRHFWCNVYKCIKTYLSNNNE